jgi:hypothetical protein
MASSTFGRARDRATSSEENRQLLIDGAKRRERFGLTFEIEPARWLVASRTDEILNVLGERNWEQDARQLMTASNEGMPGPKEGLEPQDHHRLGEVVRAKEKIGENPEHKPSQ